MNLYKLIKQGSACFAILTTLSCQQEITEPIAGTREKLFAPEPYVEKGIVHFSDDKSFIKTVEYFRTASEVDRTKFKREEGFSSFFTSYLMEKKEFDEESKRDSSSKTVNTKFLTYKNGVSTINFVTSAIASVANEDGLLFIGKSLVRFIGNKEIVVNDGNVFKAMNYVNYKNDKDVIIFDTEISSSQTSQARIAATCPRLFGQTGSFSPAGDGSRIDTKTRPVPVPLGYDDQFNVFFYVKTVGTFVNSGWFDGNSNNNQLNDVYTCEVYNHDNIKTAVRQVINYSTSTGHSIEHEDAAIFAGQCYSFQVKYYYAELSKGVINPIPSLPCTIANCQYTYPVYSNDKHTLSGACAQL